MSQTQTFDPYYTWLGIPPEEQPPNHYRLLGIKAFETNLDVIANAADQRVRHVRTYQSGKYADVSQEVLNKLSSARVCLLNEQQKADYDAHLRNEEKPGAAAPAPAPRPAASRSGTKLPVAAALVDTTIPSQGQHPTAVPQHGPQGMHGPGAHPQHPGMDPLAGPKPGVPQWMILAALGGGALVLLVMGGIVWAIMASRAPSPPIVQPGPFVPQPGPRPGPFVNPGPGPGPGPGPPSPFVPVPGGSNEKPRMVDGALDGAGTDPSVTTGLIGEVRAGPARMLVRYRLGQTIEGTAFEKLRQEKGWPQVPMMLRLTGSIDVRQPSKAFARLDVFGNRPSPSHVRIGHQTWLQRGSSAGTEIRTSDLTPGVTQIEWMIMDVTSGAWKLELASDPDRSPLPVATSVAQLSNIRDTRPDAELIFASKPLLVTNNGGTFSAIDLGSAAIAVVPMPRPVPGGAIQPAPPSDAVIGADDDVNATTGLLGRLTINGQDSGVLIRYRVGGVLTQAKLNEVLRAFNIATGNQRLELQSSLAVEAITADIRQMTRGYGEVELYDPRLRILSRAGRGNPEDVTRSITFTAAGSGRFRWELDGSDFGDSQLTLSDKASGTKLQVYYTKNDLDAARRQAETLCEMVVLSDKVLFRDKTGDLVATIPPDASAPTGDDAPVRGDEEDPATTTGLVGRLLIDGQDVGIVFRYRLGRPFNSGWFDDLRRQLNLPAGMPELVLTGTIEVPKPRAGFGGGGKHVTAKMSGGTRNGGSALLTVDGSRWIDNGGANYQLDGTYFNYMQPGKHAVKWTIKGAPIGDCLLSLNTTDGQKVEVTYSTNELKAARKLPLKSEFVLADKHTLALRYTGGRLNGTTKIPTDPTAGGPTVLVPPTAPEGPEAKRDPVPSEEKLKGAEALVKDVFGKEIDAAKNATDKAALSKKMLQSSRETNDDPAARYVLLSKARDFAASGGDTVTMCAAVDELDGAYDVDGLKMKSSGFFQASNAPLPPADFGPMTREVLDLIDATIADDRFDLATKLTDVAGECARRSKDKDLAKLAGDKKRDVTAFKKQYEAIDAAQQTLKAMPDDAAANLTLGKYKALVKGDWTAGLPLLAKGSDGAVAAASKLDAAGAADKDAKVKIGDAWWALAESAPAEEQLPYKLRAHFYYKQALAELDGIAKLRVEKRVAEVDDEASKQASRTKPAGGPARPQPGLLARVFDGVPTRNRPTHMLAVVSDSNEINTWVEESVRDETNRLGISISSHYVLTGYIYLTANTTVSVDVTYAAVSVDGRALTDATFTPNTFNLPLTRGLHPITIVCNNTSSMKFTVLDQKSGSNVLYYEQKLLQAELTRTVAGPRGQAIKSALLQRKAP